MTVARLTGMLLIYLSAAMALPLAVSLTMADGAQFALMLSALVVLVTGLLLRNMAGRHADYQVDERGSIWVAVVIWTVVPLCGALPYLLTGSVSRAVDALFESFSGFTTTGSSVMGRPEELPAGLLVYRAMTQWIGGLGLLLFVVAILRKLGIAASGLYSAEFSGTQQRKLHPRLSRSVSRLWRIYILLTLAMMVLLLVQGVPMVDALSMAFSTVSTGGFVTHSAGVARYGQGVVALLVVFMFLSGVNVALLYRFFTFRWRHLWRDEELRVYVALFVLAALACTLTLGMQDGDWWQAVGYSLFHVASTMSTCGYYLPHSYGLPLLAGALTFVLIVVGASSGSTGGGIKLRRMVVLVKYVGNYFTRMLHPGAVFRVKVNGEVVDDPYIHKVFAFVFLYIAFIVTGAFVLTLCGCDIPEALCMAAANVSNLGPSPLINGMGGNLDYALLPEVAKVTLAVLMLAGRLEIFALVAVCSPAYWRKKR